MTEVLNHTNTFPFGKSLDTKCGFTSPLPHPKHQPKNGSLSRDEILFILQDLVIESPLVDYMVAHGVISQSSAQELMTEECKGEQKIRKLLQLLDSEYDTPQHFSHNAKLVLLTNALRSTGQHSLASRLDCGRKIKPAPLATAKLSDTGYGSDLGKKMSKIFSFLSLLYPTSCLFCYL